LTLHALASRINYTAQHISEVELAHASASEAFVAACDKALDAHGALLALYPAVKIEQLAERENRETLRRSALRFPQEVDDVKRRAFIGLGLAVVLLGPEAVARASADDWDRIAAAWTHEVATAPDRQALLPGLMADLRRLAEAGGPQRAIAQLSVCAAMIALSGGDAATARRWWSRAHVAARAHGDRELTAYVAGQHAYDGVYALYKPAKALAVADRAVAVTDAPCAGRMHALSARARALALLNREREATEAMNELERSFERLPGDVARRTTVGGWSEARLLQAGSFVAAYGGADSSAAHDDARAADEGIWRLTAQIELHRAAGEADAQHAVKTLGSLSRAQRGDQFVRRLAGRTMLAIESSGADASNLREALA
jgi:hypothetical protein